MTRAEFMRELEGLLLEISLEERTEALKYYEDYFEDAGPEAEEEIIKKLDTPQHIAAIIKADLAGEGGEGGFTETGYQDSPTRENEVTLSKGQENTQSDYHTRQNTQYSDRNQNNRKQSNIVLIILLCIFAIPVGLPLIITAFALAIAVIAVIFSLFAAFFFSGIAFVFAGVVLAAAGIMQLFIYPPGGAIFLGMGLILLGSGFLMTIIGILICSKILPGFIKGFGNFLSRIFGGGRRRQGESV